MGNQGAILLAWDPSLPSSGLENKEPTLLAAAGILQTLLDRCQRSAADAAVLLAALPARDRDSTTAIPWLAVIERLDAYLAALHPDSTSAYAAHWGP
ncbi:MAG: hypothetical protein HY696_04715 [Deltaproteobacteria bacterium]|nr:hypothetical protein [Deltaproteobacteria bacterium]